MSFANVAKVLLIDEDMVRTWHRLYEEDGIEGLAGFVFEGSAWRLGDAQKDRLQSLDQRDAAANHPRGRCLDRG